MKIILPLICLSLVSCTTITETRPDGTVIVTKGIDATALAIGAGTATTIYQTSSGK